MGVSIGNKIELVHLKQVIQNESNKTVYVSKIYDILPNNMLQIAMPIHAGRIVPLDIDEKYTACFYTDVGLLQCNVLVVSRYKKGNLFFLEVALLGELAKVQRREFYRYNCMLEGKIRIVSDEEYDTGIPAQDDKIEWDTIKILDISGGGAKIVTRNLLARNEVVKVKFCVDILNEVVVFDLFARILAGVPLKLKANMYEQRLEFMKIKQEERDKIIKFIFESERMNRAKKVGLNK